MYFEIELADINIGSKKFLTDLAIPKNRIPFSTFTTEMLTYGDLYHILHGRTLSCRSSFFTVIINLVK